MKTRPVQFEQFNPIFPAPYQFKKEHALRLARRDLYPSYTRVTTQRSPAIFDSLEVLEWARGKFSLTYPTHFRALEKAFGIMPKKTAKKKVISHD